MGEAIEAMAAAANATEKMYFTRIPLLLPRSAPNNTQ
jgi:hypothetical protein